MPIDNYVNPAAIAPPIGWQPQGALGGMAYADRTADYDKNMALSQLVQQMAAQKTASENQDFQAARPSTLEALIAKNNAVSQTAVPQAQANLAATQGNNRATELANKFNDATFQSRVKETLSSNLEKGGERAMQQLQRTIHAASILAMMGEAKPAEGGNAEPFTVTPSMANSIISSVGEDVKSNPFAAMMAQSPASAKQLKELLDNVMTDYRQKGQLQSQKEDADYKRAVKVAEIEAQARIEAAGLSAGSSSFEAKALLGAYTAEAKRQNPDMTPEQIGKLAADQYVRSKYGALGGKLEPVTDAGTREALRANVDKAAKIDATAGLLPADDPLRKQMEAKAKELRGGAAPAAPAISGLPKVTNQAEYDKVEPGQSYIGPDGKTRTKQKGN